MRWIRENLLGDESRRYQDYANQLRNLGHSYSPYTSAGKQGLSTVMSEYGRGLQSPSFLEDELARAYQPSPYEQMEEDHLKKSLANEAAVRGTLGGSYAGQTLAETLHRLLSSDMDKYIDRGMNTYNTALSGESSLPSLGMNALGAQNSLNQGALQSQLQGNLSKDMANQKFFGYGGRLFSGLFGNLINPSSAAMGAVPYSGSYTMSPVGQLGNPQYENLYDYQSSPYFR